jgi:ribonuclease T2
MMMFESAQVRKAKVVVALLGLFCTLLPSETVAQAQCVLPEGLNPPGLTAASSPNNIQPDSHAFVWSWSPAHCATTNDPKSEKDRWQCSKRSSSFEFVVHGLWPQNSGARSNKDHPAACKTVQEPVSSDIVQKTFCKMPSPVLMQHQWTKHGVCGWDEARGYFNAISSLYDRYRTPSFVELATDGEATVAEIKAAFVEASGNVLRPEQLNVRTYSKDVKKRLGEKHEVFREVMLCLDLSLKPATCPRQEARDDLRLAILAPRPSSASARGTLSTLAMSRTATASDLRSATRPTNDSRTRWEQLRAVNSNFACPQRQTRFGSYNAAKRVFCTTIYCAAPFTGGKRMTQGGAEINIEHVVPQSRIRQSNGKGDLHNLWPSIMRVNAARSNYVLVSDIPGERYAFAGNSSSELAECDFEVAAIQALDGRRITAVEPAPHARGALARSSLHMYLAYGSSTLSRSEVETFRSWHAMHPVSDEARSRNDLIEALQGTRNPLVDFPESVSALMQACVVGQ